MKSLQRHHIYVQYMQVTSACLLHSHAELIRDNEAPSDVCVQCVGPVLDSDVSKPAGQCGPNG